MAYLPTPAAGRRIGAMKGRLSVGVGPPERDALAIIDLRQESPPPFDWDGVVMAATSVTPNGKWHTVTGELSAPVDSPMSLAFADVHASGLAGEDARALVARFGLWTAPSSSFEAK